MEPVVAPAIAAIRREVALADAESTNVVGRDEVVVMVVEEPPTTVKIVVITNDSVAETDCEVD